MEPANDSQYISVAEFYRGKSVFISGGTGFLGKVLVEKLLYSCTGIGKVLLLLRDKNGTSADDRLEKMLNSPLNRKVIIEGECCMWIHSFSYVKAQAKQSAIRESMQFFPLRSWMIKSGRARELFTSQSSQDQQLFPCDPTEIVWAHYIPAYFHGIKTFLLNLRVN
ncbi:unnamed protein product, partial [Iphiclides podalirius]